MVKTTRIQQIAAWLVALLLLSGTAQADISYVVVGVDKPLSDNVMAHVDTIQFGPRARFRPRDEQKIVENAIADARAALRPFGFYAAEVTARVTQTGAQSAIVEIAIDPGPPLQVASADIATVGDGAREEGFQSWLRSWPLREGATLVQPVWEEYKQQAFNIANDRGYLGADFSVHVIELDLEQNTANLRLEFDTGPRYVMGTVSYSDHGLKPGILEYIPRFEQGDFYAARLVSRFRTDLWKTGFFDDITVREIERPDLSPPAVDFDVAVATETKNHYNGAIGWGDDTGIRVMANYSRHPMSSYGDRLDIGIGYQDLNDQFTLRGRYRKPIRDRARHWWDTEVTFRFENLDLDVKRDEEDEEAIKIASGDLTERHIRFGRLRLRNLRGGEAQQFTTPFVQFLNSELNFGLSDGIVVPFELGDELDFEARLRTIENAFSVGFDYEVIDVDGRRFDTIGRRDRAWVFHSDRAFGSTVEFTQFYAATRRSYRLGDNFKFHVRAEVGYTDADVNEVVLDVEGEELKISQTRLPNFYRFRAGGSMSVRGYGFEQLSNNDIGSNHIVTGSVETEYRFLESWSGAVFYDVGNAFNDWNEPDLKRGAGVGIRWYSIAGEIRVDVAQALDFTGNPWRWHITIGTPLL